MPFPQMPLSALISTVVGCTIFLFMLYFALVSRQEEEPLATKRALMVAVLLPIPYLTAGLIDFELRAVVCLALLSITALVPIFLLLPLGNNFNQEDDTPRKRIDERDIMFSRNLLKEDSDRFNEFINSIRSERP